MQSIFDLINSQRRLDRSRLRFPVFMMTLLIIDHFSRDKQNGVNITSMLTVYAHVDNHRTSVQFHIASGWASEEAVK